MVAEAVRYIVCFAAVQNEADALVAVQRRWAEDNRFSSICTAASRGYAYLLGGAEHSMTISLANNKKALMSMTS
jgi:hypothetical protein